MRLAPAVAGICWGVAWLALAALAIGRLGGQCDACDLVNVGRSYWLALGVTAIVVLVILHRALKRPWPWLVLTAAGFAVASVGGVVPDARTCKPGTSTPQLRIVAFNAWANNTTPDAAAAWLRQARPDVIILVEAKGAAASISALLAPDYPYRVACNADMRCSTQILSRLRPVEVQSWAQGDAENRRALSAAAMTLPTAAQGPVTIVGVHLSRLLPLGQQQRELSALTRKLAKIGTGPLIVAGDFNATTANIALRDFAVVHRLGRVPTGPTWPTHAAFAGAPSLIAIDHILVNESVRIVSSAAGPVIGSDHRPILAALCIAR